MNQKKIDDSFCLSLYNEHTFSTSYFHEKPILDVSTIEESIQAILLRRVEK